MSEPRMACLDCGGPMYCTAWAPLTWVCPKCEGEDEMSEANSKRLARIRHEVGASRLARVYIYGSDLLWLLDLAERGLDRIGSEKGGSDG